MLKGGSSCFVNISFTWSIEIQLLKLALVQSTRCLTDFIMFVYSPYIFQPFLNQLALMQIQL